MKEIRRRTLPDKVSVRLGDLPPQAIALLSESVNMSRTIREALLFYAGCLSAREVLQDASLTARRQTPHPTAAPNENDAAFASLLGGIMASMNTPAGNEE